MSEQRKITSFAEFWPYYALEHSDPVNRLFHFIGSVFALIALVGLIATGYWWIFFLGFLVGYGPAWLGHFFIERNKPATFKHPFYSLAGDWVMFGYMLIGQMDAEIDRLRAERESSKLAA